MRRTSRGGWLSRLAAKRQKSWVWHPEFEPQNQKPGKSAPVTPCECRAEQGAPSYRILRRTRPSSYFTSGGVTGSFFYVHLRFARSYPLLASSSTKRPPPQHAHMKYLYPTAPTATTATPKIIMALAPWLAASIT